jgi:hypothetical protein
MSDAADVLPERVTELKQYIRSHFQDTTAEMTVFPSGAVMLDVHWHGRLFVLSYAPSTGLFGVGEVLDEDGIDNQYRFGASTFGPARDELLRLLGAVG